MGVNGPLSEFDSEEEADSFLERKGITHLISYECEECGMWHLSPVDRNTPSTHCEECDKALYETPEDAAARAEILWRDKEVALRVYECPHEDGWHLTKRGASDEDWAFSGGEYPYADSGYF